MQSKQMSILIVKLSSLGDIVHSLPLLNSIKKELPGSRVHWVVAKGFEELLEEHPLIERLWVVNKDGWKKPSTILTWTKELRVLFRELRDERYDIVIDLQGLLRSSIITASTNAPLRLGFSDSREMSHIFYNRTVRGGSNIHAVDRYLKILSLIGIEVKEVGFPLPETMPHIQIVRPYFIVAPGARWNTKIWPVEYFIRVIGSLLDEPFLGKNGNFRAVLIGSNEDLKLAEEIVSGVKEGVINMVGKTDLKTLLSIIKDASFMLTNDSGPMHIAAALSVPVFAIFGPTSEIRTGPYGNIHTVIKMDLPCRPCFKRRCKTIDCMKNVTPDIVIKKIREYSL